MRQVCMIVMIIWGLSAGAVNGLTASSQKINDLVRAARSGDTQAMCELALAYYHGRNVLKDPFTAKCWVQKAHAAGSDRAARLWDSLSLWQYSGKCDSVFDNQALPDHRAGDRYSDPRTGMAFVWMPGGCFPMGCDRKKGCARDERPVRRVCLDGFWMAVHEVTQASWAAVMETRPSANQRGLDYPVEQVSFEDAQAFLHRLNQIPPEPGGAGTGPGLRFALPTEAQWEYACRSGKKQHTHAWEEERFRPRANCGGCDAGAYQGRTSPKGSFQPNRFGLYDMGGNVREWCRDRYLKDAYSRAGLTNPVVRKGGQARVVRGGSFVDSPRSCTARDQALPTLTSPYIGFRIVIEKAD